VTGFSSILSIDALERGSRYANRGSKAWVLRLRSRTWDWIVPNGWYLDHGLLHSVLDPADVSKANSCQRIMAKLAAIPHGMVPTSPGARCDTTWPDVHIMKPVQTCADLSRRIKTGTLGNSASAHQAH
jgi:hypothetical protein